MAATIAVVYPQANALGGDGFWLIAPPNGAPFGHRGRRPGGAGHRSLRARRAWTRFRSADPRPRTPSRVRSRPGPGLRRGARPWAAACPGNACWPTRSSTRLNGMPVSVAQHRETVGHLDELAGGCRVCGDVFLDEAGAPPAAADETTRPGRNAGGDRLVGPRRFLSRHAGTPDRRRPGTGRQPGDAADLAAAARLPGRPLSLDLSWALSSTCRRRPRGWRRC